MKYSLAQTENLVADYEDAVIKDQEKRERTGRNGWNCHAHRAVDIYNSLGYALRQNPDAIRAFKTKAKNRFIEETFAYGNFEERQALRDAMKRHSVIFG